jgi:hypothetical protein
MPRGFICGAMRERRRVYGCRERAGALTPGQAAVLLLKKEGETNDTPRHTARRWRGAHRRP